MLLMRLMKVSSSMMDDADVVVEKSWKNEIFLGLALKYRGRCLRANKRRVYSEQSEFHHGAFVIVKVND